MLLAAVAFPGSQLIVDASARLGSRDGDYDDHACWVCGKKTESRCLPCSEREFDFFFCSREHQKLVWKHHKRVCGDGFFRNPLLSPEEAKLAQRIHHVPAVRNVEGRRDSLADLLHELGHPHPQHKVLIDSLVEGSKRGPTTKLEDLTLSTIRASFGGLSALTDVLTRAKNDLVVDTVWSIIAMLQFQVFFGIGIGNLTVGTEWPPWYSPFQHRVLTLLSLISSIKKSPQSTFLERYADNAAVQSSSFLEQVVEPSMYGGDECKAFLYELLNAVCDFEGILGLARSK
ncbi:hypothetical protein JCM8547_000537 [Rhodosporidiobolus lusitaniae]